MLHRVIADFFSNAVKRPFDGTQIHFIRLTSIPTAPGRFNGILHGGALRISWFLAKVRHLEKQLGDTGIFFFEGFCIEPGERVKRDVVMLWVKGYVLTIHYITSLSIRVAVIKHRHKLTGGQGVDNHLIHKNALAHTHLGRDVAIHVAIGLENIQEERFPSLTPKKRSRPGSVSIPPPVAINR